MNAKLSPTVCAFVGALTGAFSFLTVPGRAALYIPVANSFVTTPAGGETIVQLQDTSGSIATAQSTLNSARTANPSATLVLNLDASTYSVSTTGLVLGSNECLVLGPSTTIEAASSSATAGYLVQVASGSSNVSISGGTFNGDGAALNCIQVAASNRVNIASLTAEDASLNLIQVYGNGQTSFDNEITIAGCTLSTGTGTDSGISLHNATQAVVIDNTCNSCSGGSGIYAKDCAYCTIAENTCSSNSIGIYVYGNNNTVTDNTCSTNATGISLAGNGSGNSSNVCSSNTLTSNTTVGIAAAGTADILFDNTLASNTATLTLAGSSNYVISRKAALTAGQNYFYPPLVDDAQTGTVVNGLGRYDLTPTGTTFSGIQSQYNSAVSSHSGDVIVIHLSGASYTADATLTLGSDTCVLIGSATTIAINSGITAFSANDVSYVSISGGTIDGGNSTSAIAISVAGGCSMLQLDGMTIQNFGPTTPRVSTAAVHVTGQATPLLFTRCTLNQGSGRGLWLENSGYQGIISRSSFSNFNMDGVDCDAQTSTLVLKYCSCTDNYRAGVFVEQGASYNDLIGNTFDGNHSGGLLIWNNGVSNNEPATSYNSLVCNTADANIVGTPSSGSGNSNGIGIQTGSQAGSAYEEYVAHNFFFDNEMMGNEGSGQDDSDIGQGLNGTSGSVKNYYSQNSVLGNATSSGSNLALSSNGGDIFFDSVVPYAFNPVTMNPVGSGASIGSEADSHTPFGELEYLSATGTGQTLTLTSEPTVAGTYSVVLGYKAYTSRGQCTVTVDGTSVGGTIDQYSATTQYLTATLGSLTLSSGAHTIVLTVTGKNSASSAYTISADEIELIGQ